MTKPHRLDPLADRVLQALATRAEAREIVLGGYLALQHHLDYRGTHDIDAWWRSTATPEAERAFRETLEDVAQSLGYKVRERRFGETISWELLKDDRKVLSFQIAIRSVELEAPVPSAWSPILIESLADNVGAKMNALVDRGAPRDFRDIHAVATRGLVSTRRCWELWALKNPGQSEAEARQKVQLHLSSLESRRPLSSIKDPTERELAALTRTWFRKEFLA